MAVDEINPTLCSVVWGAMLVTGAPTTRAEKAAPHVAALMLLLTREQMQQAIDYLIGDTDAAGYAAPMLDAWEREKDDAQ